MYGRCVRIRSAYPAVVAALNLFDDDTGRYPGPATFSESSFHFLNRVDDAVWQRVRELLEDWYAHHPDPDGDLRSRFRDDSIRQHLPAMWELYVFTFFRRLGFSIDVHPKLPSGRQPDFLVSREQERVYVESVALFEKSAGPDILDWILACIDTASNPDFMVDVDIVNSGTQYPGRREIARPIESWLANLDYDSARASRNIENERERRVFTFRDWGVRLTARPRAPDRRGDGRPLIAIFPIRSAFSVSNVDEFRNLLRDKASQCNGADASVVIAVLSASLFAGIDELAQALYGVVQTEYSADDGAFLRNFRRTDGYWHPGPPPRGSRISGVLFVEAARTSRVVYELPRLWRKPWATYPLHTDLQLEARSATDDGKLFTVVEATTTWEAVFGLPSDWPGLSR